MIYYLGYKFSSCTHTQEEPKISEVREQCIKHNLVIDAGVVLTVLRKYTESCLNGKMESGNIAMTMAARLQRIRNTISRLISADDITLFWKRYRQIFTSDREKLWASLEHGLKIYLKNLKKRDNLDTECEFLRKQNMELKHMLEPYTMMTKQNQKKK